MLLEKVHSNPFLALLSAGLSGLHIFLNQQFRKFHIQFLTVFWLLNCNNQDVVNRDRSSCWIFVLSILSKILLHQIPLLEFTYHIEKSLNTLSQLRLLLAVFMQGTGRQHKLQSFIYASCIVIKWPHKNSLPVARRLTGAVTKLDVHQDMQIRICKGWMSFLLTDIHAY